jgi:hypothetical protein
VPAKGITLSDRQASERKRAEDLDLFQDQLFNRLMDIINACWTYKFERMSGAKSTHVKVRSYPPYILT